MSARESFARSKLSSVSQAPEPSRAFNARDGSGAWLALAGSIIIILCTKKGLGRQHALAELRRLQEDLPSLAVPEAAVRRGRIWGLLARVAPGRGRALEAVLSAAGEVHTCPDGMAAALRSHWSGVFSAKRLDGALRQRWLQEERRAREASGGPRLPGGDDARWRLRPEDVQAALNNAPATAPGPDGIPFAAWARLGALAVDVLCAAREQLSSSDAAEAIQRDL